MIVVATIDHNVDILGVISGLKEIDFSWRGGDELWLSLSSALLTIVDMIAILNDAWYSITSYMETKRREYVDGLSYNEIKKLKIPKEHIYTLFRVLGTYDISESSRPHISIKWCICQPIRDHWMEIWYMAFNIPPHDNGEVALYFLQKLCVEFVMGKHVNYFDMLGFQGIGRGIPQN